MFSKFIISTLIVLPSITLYTYSILTIPDTYVPRLSSTQIVSFPPYQVFKVFGAIVVAQTIGSLLIFLS